MAHTVPTIHLWSDFSPPLPTGPRPNLRRASQNSEYYVNEGEDPEKPYQSIPPYVIMASNFSGHQRLQPPPALNQYINHSATDHVYDTVSDEEEMTSKAATPEEEYVLFPNRVSERQEGVKNDYVKMSSGTEKAEEQDFINSCEVQDSDSAEKMSNNEYVLVPNSHNYVNIQIEDGNAESFLQATHLPSGHT